jgi:hypothetical protein
MREEQWESEQKILKLCIGITKRFRNFFLNFVVVLPRKLMLMIGQNAMNSQSELSKISTLKIKFIFRFSDSL